MENPTASLHRDRIFAVASLAENALKDTPAPLASIPLLDEMESYWQLVLSELDSFQDDQNIGHLSSAASFIDSHIQPALATFLMGTGSNAKSATFPAMFRQQAKYAQETVNNFKHMRDESLNQLEHLSFQADDIKSWIKEAGQTLMQQKVDVENAALEFKKVFEAEEGKRNLHSQRVLKTFQEDAQAREDESKLQNLNHGLYLQKQKEQAARVVELIGEIGVTGNYQKIANAETKEADFWRWITIGFFSAGVLLAIATLWNHWDDVVTVNSAISILVKLLYAVVITTPAWYAAKESARHRTTADRARQAELELASIGPFIELMPEAKKVEIREHLSKLYFGRSIDNHNIESFMDGKTVKEIMVELINALKPEAKG